MKGSHDLKTAYKVMLNYMYHLKHYIQIHNDYFV